MKLDTLLFEKTLENGLTLEARDFSRRYYGDYYKVIVDITCRLEPSIEHFSDAPNPDQALQEARRLLGEQAQSTTRLERMGVAGESLEAVRSALLDSFTGHALTYMRRPDYPVRFLQILLEQKRRHRPQLRPVG